MVKMKRNNLPEHFRVLQVDEKTSNAFLEGLIKKFPERKLEFTNKVKHY